MNEQPDPNHTHQTLWANYEILVLRPTEPDVNAVFRCIAEIGSTPDEILRRVVRGVTKWAAETDIGKAALEDSNGDFNIGDLMHYIDDARDWLSAEGIKDAEIAPNNMQRGSWNYDTLLCRDADPLVATSEDATTSAT